MLGKEEMLECWRTTVGDERDAGEPPLKKNRHEIKTCREKLPDSVSNGNDWKDCVMTDVGGSVGETLEEESIDRRLLHVKEV